MKFGVVVFPGSNCDQDLVDVITSIPGQQAVKLWHKSHDLQEVDFVALPGGFSFGDYLRSGAIARFSPIMQQVISFAHKGGYVMGICNGFQILTEAGLLPGALLHNDTRKFICKNTYIKAQTNHSLITAKLSLTDALKIPIAHGEGKFYASADDLKAINENNQVLFRYCDQAGNITAEANPNGSLQNIAGVCNINRNVFGMMPHPERAANPVLGNQDGMAIFESILAMVNA
ncbi:MAG: phosphoribosylformylglycinamidine synthase subunit PurQ [Sphingobacteriales bacterium]|nr:MAG: phosphoribosylformylglycinamidine synthase subunit PurQ [Sphingobacteriales bacterium]TAF80593.1 MAG: phosphoribosylformylglycinamidine synthase subunit PurQ [Sphingobacteriales bacterium]